LKYKYPRRIGISELLTSSYECNTKCHTLNREISI